MKKELRGLLKKYRVRFSHEQVRHRRLWICGGVILFALVLTWFWTSVPDTAARYVWERYQDGSLALSLGRTDASLALQIGEYYFGNQAMLGVSGAPRPYDLKTAGRAFKKASAINPLQPLAHYMLARIEFIGSDFDAALQDLNMELALNPEFKRTLYMRGLTFTYRGSGGDYARAESDFQEFIAWAPTEWAGYNDFAFVLGKDKKYSAAMAIAKEGIAKADGGATNPWLWDLLGVMQLNLNEPSSALASFLNARTYAASLSSVDWQRAYPGNSPSTSQSGVGAMQAGIGRNIIAARDALEK